MTKQIKRIFKKIPRHFYWLLLYGVFYMISFYLLEQRSVRIHLIHCELDDLIPFCEYFIIPYLLWFPFMGLTILYFGVIQKDKKQFTRLAWNLCIGTTIFLLISWIYPNGQRLRPAFTGDNIFGQIVGYLYQVDTPTNILPSLHVYGTVVCCLAILESEQLQDRKWLRIGTTILGLSIIASTVFLKQHSVVDGIAAILLNTACYILCYRTEVITQLAERQSAIQPDQKKKLRYRMR